MRRFEGSTVLVVGASSGIGKACAVRFADEGARVICAARNRERLEQAAADLAGSGHSTLTFDAADEAGVDAATAQLKAEGRTIDAAVLCAGQHSLRPVQLLKAAGIDQMLAANVRSALLCTRMAAKLASREGASVVWLSSAAAMVGNIVESVYAAGNGALISAGRAVATELASKRIRVNVVAPGVVETPMSESWIGQLSPEQKAGVQARHLLGFGKPEDVAGAIAFLASGDARWITGTCLTVDGGLTCH